MPMPMSVSAWSEGLHGYPYTMIDRHLIEYYTYLPGIKATNTPPWQTNLPSSKNWWKGPDVRCVIAYQNYINRGSHIKSTVCVKRKVSQPPPPPVNYDRSLTKLLHRGGGVLVPLTADNRTCRRSDAFYPPWLQNILTIFFSKLSQ